MSYENIATVEQFRQLDPDQQKECLADQRVRIQQRLDEAYDRATAERMLERQLVPHISFKPTPPPEPNRIEVAPPSGDSEQAARNFFRQFPETRSIRIGDTIYERK